MVDYVGDMMKPYQNGVDRIQRGVYTDVQHITKCFRFFFVFISIDQRTAQTAEAILMVNGSKDMIWRKEVSFGGQNNIVEGLGGQIPPKTHNFLAVIGNSYYKVARRQTAITF
jgi:hypothetical protein